MRSVSSQAVIALGSNLGESEETLLAAAIRLGATPGIEQIQMSQIYTSAPALVTDQPLFKNAVALIETSLSPLDLLHTLQAIEAEFGRVREGEGYLRYGPRTLDLDIIDYEGVVMDEDELILPHPEALHRDFVVTPLLEVSPNHVLANLKVVNNSAVECGAILDTSSDATLDGQSDGTTAESTSQQSTAQPGERGCLFICATPIGNLGDITLRVLETLRLVDSIYCEDTRVTRKLTSRYEIKAPLKRADAHKLSSVIPIIVDELAQGQRLAYVSDAGMPGISDPGALLVSAVREAGFAVEILPGASALTTALVASGIKAHNCYFGGFFPRKYGAGMRLLQELSVLEDTVLVFYESVHRTVKTLNRIAEVLPSREVTLARELTKLHEEVLTAPALELAATLEERVASGRPLKGEIVILIAPQ